LDAGGSVPRLRSGSAAAQIASAVALVFHPAVVCTVLVLGAWWCWRRRLRNLAWAALLAGPAAWALAGLLKRQFQRPRPVSPLADALTYAGFSYPSSHVAVITAAAMVVVMGTTTTHQSARVTWGWRVVSAAAIVAVALNRWFMNAHWVTDLVGGALTGGTAASLVALLCRVRMLPAAPLRSSAVVARPTGGLCAFIYNPERLNDEATARRIVTDTLARRGWEAPLFLPTTRSDHGAGMVAEALRRQADLVLGAGGDGTIRIICNGLANTGVPFGLLPAGTGNLLARNLGVPLDLEEAVRVAFDGVPTAVDLIKLTVDGDDQHAEHFAVMGGVGFDAVLMENTSARLKRAIGSAAYVVAAAQELGVPPHRVRFRVDGAAETRSRAVLTLLGNVGSLGPGVQLVPDADPTDGRMELIIGSPTGVSGWARLAAKAMARVGVGSELEQFTGREVSIRLDEPLPYELDGDTLGRGQRFDAEVVPGALILMLPANRGGGAAAE
jgi:diacylglycerol kinase family enzyme/membrane-associated phospholipid phosphatase